MPMRALCYFIEIHVQKLLPLSEMPEKTNIQNHLNDLIPVGYCNNPTEMVFLNSGTYSLIYTKTKTRNKTLKKQHH